MSESCKLRLQDSDHGPFLEVNLEYGEHEKPASTVDPDTETFNINNAHDNEALLELLIERMVERYE